MKILVINAGSSSMKYQLINMDTSEVLAKGNCDRIGIDGVLTHKTDKCDIKKEVEMKNHAKAIEVILSSLVDSECGVIKSVDEINAVGHRIVHAGKYVNSCVVDDQVTDYLISITPLAPLHNPGAVAGIKACMQAMPNIKHVTVFDTAFHTTTMPAKAYMYGIPYEYYEKESIRKYGFHGTSHKYVSKAAARALGKNPEELKIVSCHLGNGSSITAVDGGKSVDTTMGFTPLDGLIMGTRSGSLDPTVVTYIINNCGVDPKDAGTLFNKKSGVLGISGLSSDFRDLEKAADEGNERAKLALDMFTYQVIKYIGSFAAAMGGVDAILFTGGIGENNIALRAEVAKQLAFLGVEIDEKKNNVKGKYTEFSTENSKVKMLVVPTNEEYMIAKETMELAF